MKKNLLPNLLCLIYFGALASEKVPSSASRNDWALTSSAALDLPRYMGTWYEIAKYPNWFQKKCTGEARAEYSLLPDGNQAAMKKGRLKRPLSHLRFRCSNVAENKLDQREHAPGPPEQRHYIDGHRIASHRRRSHDH